jgi:putative ABC transport system permease protein
MKNKPPKISKWLLSKIQSDYNQSSTLGDLDEEFLFICENEGVKNAKRWFRWQVLKSIPSSINHKTYWSFIMFKNYFKIAFRNLVKQKLYSSINIFGLSVSLALCLIVLGHVAYELSFEDIHKNKDKIYRVNGRYASEGYELYSAKVMASLGKALVNEIPEVEKAAIFRVLGNINLQIDEKKFKAYGDFENQGYEHSGNVICANSDFLDVFTFPLLQGDPETILEEPFSLLISENAAKEYFPNQNPIGKLIKINNDLECHVTGILKNIPENTQLHCDFIISYPSLKKTSEGTETWNHLGDDYVYVLLNEKANPKEVEQKIPSIISKHFTVEEAKKHQFDLQNLKDIYFNVYGSRRQGELYPAGESENLYAWLSIAVFILLIAVTNFVNLSTARSTERVKEVGIRKVFGAFRTQLIKQFLGESFLITCCSIILSLFLYSLFKSMIKPVLPREMFADFYNNALLMVFLISLVVVVGLFSGFYPALHLSRFKPIAILQSRTNAKSSKSILRKGLIVFQFTIAIGFICCTAIISKQIHFITSMELGFNNENILVLDFEGEDAAKNCALMKNEILHNNPVLAVSSNNCPPGRDKSSYYGFYRNETRQKEDFIITKTYSADYDFLSTFGLEIIAGREFKKEIVGDINHAIIINESAAKTLNIDNPLGYTLYGGKNQLYEVVGVVKDFHGSRLDHSSEYMSVIMLDPEHCTSLSIKLPSEDIKQSITNIQKTWESTLPGIPFNYMFLDDEIRTMYSEYKAMIKLLLTLSLISISIACLGILGLASYTAEQRTREIGIRKVLGASVSNIVKMLSKEFVILIIISNLIAWPLAYLAMNGFLQAFAYKVKIGIDIFILSGSIVLFLALFLSSFQAIRASLANPVDTLKYE